jgi:hypothetical protein
MLHSSQVAVNDAGIAFRLNEVQVQIVDDAFKI